MSQLLLFSLAASRVTSRTTMLLVLLFYLHNFFAVDPNLHVYRSLSHEVDLGWRYCKGGRAAVGLSGSACVLLGSLWPAELDEPDKVGRGFSGLLQLFRLGRTQRDGEAAMMSVCKQLSV